MPRTRPNPTDMSALQCISEDQKGGGKSRIVSVDAIISRLKEMGHYDIVKRLREYKYPFSLDPRFGDSGMHIQHVLTREKYDGKNYHFIRFLKTDIENTAKKFKIKLPKTALEALNEVKNSATKIGKKEEFLVRKGDLLLFDNRRALHSRSHVDPKSKRKLKRIKLNLDRKTLFKS